MDFSTRPSRRPTPPPERDRILAAPGFGEYFTDHMITMRWSGDRGWHDGRLEPYGPLALEPATAAFHYAQEFFEGLKAYRQENDAIVLFRPEVNAARFNAAARRLAMPELPEELFLRALELLVTADRDWVPTGDGYSLYLRPFMIATQRGLGFTLPSRNYLFCAIASPATFLGGSVPRPLAVWLAQDCARAIAGGTGNVKASANYAAAFLIQRRAVEQGCDQVVWLDAVERRWVEEMGGMNLFFVRTGSDGRTQLMTPALTGTLLPGVTRDSLLRLAPALGLDVEEERISVAQWHDGCVGGEITEVFACGTAATIIPVGRVRSATDSWTIGDGSPGPVTLRLREELLGIQYGHRSDPESWIHKVC
jgi:branched-chain amino acid aminotransferase